MAGKIVLWMGVSLDGYIEGPNREIDWHRVDAELHGHMNDELAKMGVFLEGRVTYELMEAYWPTADAEPGAAPEIVQFAEVWRGMPKVVYSRTLQQVGPNATLAREVVPDEVRALAAQADGDLCVGGAGLADTFLALDLVDEYRVYVHPVRIGRGRLLFPPVDRGVVPLRLLETRPFSNGVVLLRYARE